MNEPSANDREPSADDEEMDWDRFNSLTDEDIAKAVADDPDARPLTNEELREGLRAPNVRQIREKYGLSQAEFAKAFRLSRRTVQEWEQGRSLPNYGYSLYLNAIADPHALVHRVEAITGETRRHPTERVQDNAGDDAQ